MTTYPRAQHWAAEDFRVTVMLYKSSADLCGTCGKRPAMHAVWADGRGSRQGWSGVPQHFCDEHRPVKGTLPPLKFERHLTGDSQRTVITELLAADQNWPCTACGVPARFRVITRCWGCADPERVRAARGVLSEHAVHVLAESYHCDAHAPEIPS